MSERHETFVNRSRRSYQPKAETLALLKVSGNPINGLGETQARRPSPFFWHPPDQHPYGELQIVARQNSRKCPGAAKSFAAAYAYPELIPVASERNAADANILTAEQGHLHSHTKQMISASRQSTRYMFSKGTPSKSLASSCLRSVTITNG
jgi:epoxyqueuosine reductase